ncbi:N-6 DNA methylase, partial [Streptococcus suis]
IPSKKLTFFNCPFYLVLDIYQLFIQHIIHSLKEDGQAAIVLPTGFITAQSGIDKKIRQHLVDEKMLAGVVSMPSNIFATTGTNVSILFIDKKNKDDVVLIDASNLGTKVKEGKNQKTVLSPEEEVQIIETFIKQDVVEDFSVKVGYDEIKDKNYSLSAGQYFDIKIDYVDISPEGFEEKMQGYQDRLANLFAQSHELEKEIAEQMRRVRYE